MQSFLDCIAEQLAAKGFGEARAKAITDRATNLSDEYRQQGDPNFEQRAINQVFAEHAEALATKARLKQADLAKLAARKQRFSTFNYNTAVFGRTNASADAGQVVKAMLERDPRSGDINYFDTRYAMLGKIWALANEAVERMGKGTWGISKGKMYEPNVIREMHGEHTGDDIAHHIAHGYLQAGDAAVDLFNAAGGAMKKLDHYVPQKRSVDKLLQRGEDFFVSSHSAGGENPVDWSRMRWPDGSQIKPEQRENALRESYKSLVTDGRNRQPDDAGRGQGSSVGNKIDDHRFLVYQNADAWMAAHANFGEGNLLDTMNSHFDKMAHDTAMVQIFGSNPKMGYDNAKLMALKEADRRVAAGEVSRDYLAKTQQTLSFTDKMFSIMNRENPLAAESTTGHLVSGTSNIMTSAMLGSVPLLGITDDMTKMGMMSVFNKMGMSPMRVAHGIISTWLTDVENREKMTTQAGLIMSELVQSNYAAQRYGTVANYAPSVTRRISDVSMRASGMAGWTKSAKAAVQMEFMGMLGRDVDKPFEQLPYANMMQRYGIGPNEWDAMRQTPLYDPVGGKVLGAGDAPSQAPWLRPIDHLDSAGLEQGLPLYTKFQNMILAETRYAIPENTVEAQVALRDTTRPDTLGGALLSSFAMYKNFPISMLNQYGRLAMSSTDRTGRLAFIAGLGVTMTMVGALGVQLRELTKGRDPLPMNTAEFLGRAFLAGGALSIYGDFLFGGVNEYGHSGASQMAGPVFGFASDATQAALGDPFHWIQDLEQGKQLRPAQMPTQLVQLLKHYTPGSSLWWGRLALEREVWDRLAAVADSKAYSKFANQRRAAQKQGNDYWWAPGSDFSSARLPQLPGGTQ